MYTKGEWISKGLIIQCNPNGSVIATANRFPFEEGEGEANAHLIAASPRMATFIQRIMKQDGWLNQADLAEAKEIIETLDL